MGTSLDGYELNHECASTRTNTYNLLRR